MKVLKKQTNSKYCIICGLDNRLGVKAPFYNLEDGSVATVFQFKPEHQSYPGRTHGGMISSMLDELMGRALWVTEPDTYGVTTTMNVTFRKPVPYDATIKGRAIIVHNSKLGFSTKGELYDENNNLLAQGNAKYLKLPTEKINENVSVENEMCYDVPDDVTELDFPEMK